mgnify:CR=1 FL=1
MHFNTIETERLILRPITRLDAQDFFELDSNANVHQYLGNKPVKTIEESRAMIDNIIEQYKINGIGRLAIIDKNTKLFIGWSGLKFEQNLRQEFDYYDIGYRLKEQYWGKGYATEAAFASLDYGFNTLNLKEICAAAHMDNIASNTILKKIGMKTSGTFKYEGLEHNWYSMINPSL